MGEWVRYKDPSSHYVVTPVHAHVLSQAHSMSIDSLPQKVDVLVVGGGPTGLLTNYILLKNGLKALSVGQRRAITSGWSILILVRPLERYSRTEQATYGRACVLYPRSLEFLDMVGIYERIADTGFIVR